MMLESNLDNAIYVIDASVVLRLCTHQQQLAAKLFIADDPVDKNLIAEVAQSLITYL